MTPSQAVELTAYIQAHFPSQPVSEFTPDALHERLANFAMADCRAAVLTHAEQAKPGERAFCSPGDVVAGVKRIRAKRITEHPPLVPPPGLTEPQEREWQGRARKAIGDGGTIEGRDPSSLTKRDMRELSARRSTDEPAEKAPESALAVARAGFAATATQAAAAESAKRTEREAENAKRAAARDADRVARAVLADTETKEHVA